MTVRKIRHSRILPFEREQVVAAIKAHTDLEIFLVEADGDALVVYLPDLNAGRIIDILERHVGFDFRGERSPGLRETKQPLIQQSNYSKMMRFILQDADQRSFLAQRWCFRGSYDDW